ncbi:biotin-dependent carboxyltransferase family protein [Herbaspirillum frisingense]|uniref:5-oxoprolinase subunit C family protein n=1 Tax=Herbaspirillum TaxID=963 RepID=UPI000981CDF4|nr:MULTISPECIES: biotin-dependent carboxyltransferase family protein [Herbaspirillum]ONN67477.1 allophanate hydrolase [Herbaspirillum sp. VT-16-41]QNB07021.1 biotin-dependent carboxyltransferase family protein [Herbaspirillum frisingense]
MIEILQPGMLASVQDLGRPGHRSQGIHPGGALNALALASANLLVGNAPGAAGIEITMGLCELRFGRATRIALGGDDIGATLDGKPISACWSLPVSAGSVLRLAPVASDLPQHPARHSMRSYLAVAGGIDVPVVLDSRSTDLKAGFGGHQGRALKRGDKLAVGDDQAALRAVSGPAFGVRAPDWSRSDLPAHQRGGHITLRVLPGPEIEEFTKAAREAFWSTPWRITPSSNRMGYRLEGEELKRKHARDMLSHGVVPGVIQVPPSGQPIILMGDAQTTGGYPKIGVVIGADLWKLAQAPLNATLRLEPCTLEQALLAAEQQQRYLDTIRDTVAALDWSRATLYKK